MEQQSDIMSVRVPAAMHNKIAELAKQWERSQNWVVNQALEQFIDLQLWQQRQIELAVAEADAGGKFYTSEEVDAMIAKWKPHKRT